MVFRDAGQFLSVEQQPLGAEISDGMDKFSDDILYHIFLYLDPEDLRACSHVSKRLHRVANDSWVWWRTAKRSGFEWAFRYRETIDWKAEYRWRNANFAFKFLCGHSDKVTSVVLDEIHGKIISGSADETIRIWDNATRVCEDIVSTAGGSVSCLKSDSGKIWFGTSRGSVSTWDIQGRSLVATLDKGHDRSICSLCFLDEGRNLCVTGSADATVRMWDLRQRDPFLSVWSQDGSVLCLEKLSDHEFVSGSRDKTLRVFDVRAMKLRKAFFTGACVRAMVRLDGKQFVIGGGHERRGVLQKWDFSDESEPGKHDSFGHVSAITGLSRKDRISCFASASWDGNICLWNENVNLIVRIFHPKVRVPFSSVDFGQRSLVASCEQYVYKLDFADLEEEPLSPEMEQEFLFPPAKSVPSEPRQLLEASSTMHAMLRSSFAQA